MIENLSMELKVVSTGEESALDMRFVLAPLQSLSWERAFEAASAASDWPSAPRLERSWDRSSAGYVVYWEDGPQDVDVALQFLDEYIKDADAAQQQHAHLRGV